MDKNNLPENVATEIAQREQIRLIIDFRMLHKGKEDTILFVDKIFSLRSGKPLLDYYLSYGFSYTKEFRQKLFDYFESDVLNFMFTEVPNLKIYVEALENDNLSKDVDKILDMFHSNLTEREGDTVIVPTDKFPNGMRVMTALFLSKSLQSLKENTVNGQQLTSLILDSFIPVYYHKEWRPKIDKGK